MARSSSLLPCESASWTHFGCRPRPGHTYPVRYPHQKKAYGIQMTETDVSSQKTSRLRVEDWDTC